MGGSSKTELYVFEINLYSLRDKGIQVIVILPAAVVYQEYTRLLFN